MNPNTEEVGRARRTRRTGIAGGFWSPPNLLSLSRIATVPFIYWSFARDSQLGLYALIGWAFLTDAADGYLARRFRWESKWGLVLDPLADKILVGSLAVFLVLFRDFPPWAAVLIIARDLSILGAGVYIYLRPGSVVLPADRIGKLTTLVMGGALFLYARGPAALWSVDALGGALLRRRIGPSLRPGVCAPGSDAGGQSGDHGSSRNFRNDGSQGNAPGK